MLAVKHGRVCLLLMVVCVGLTFGGCGNGDAGRETVFLYITNGYPGASKMTLYGPTGTLASGLGFGERTDEAVEVDRNVNSSDFKVVFDGAPTAIDFSKPLFSMYPQETGTLVVTRRAAESAAEATLYRHIRTPDPDCTLVFGNSLSLDNQLAPEVTKYSYQTEWRLPNRSIYDQKAEQFAPSECGYVQIPEAARRTSVFDGIDQDPWYFPVKPLNSNKAEIFRLVWGVRRVDPRTGKPRSEGLTARGQVVFHPPTSQVLPCLSDAVNVEKASSGGGGQTCPSPAAGAPQGPDGKPALTTDVGGVTVSTAAARGCYQTKVGKGFPVDPGEADSFQVFGLTPGSDPANPSERICGFPVRIRTPIQDLVFQNVDDGGKDFVEGDGGLIEVDASFPISEQHFFVTYGRPVNAFVDQWNGEATSVGLDEYGYPGDKVPTYDNDSFR